MSRVAWAPGRRFRINAEAAYAEIAGLEAIDARSLVSIGRDPQSAWHRLFEWDDSVAAERYRETQAREALRSFVLIRDDGDYEPIFVHVVTEEISAYQPLRFVLRQPSGFELALAEARRDLAGAQRSMSTLLRIAAEEGHTEERPQIARAARTLAKIAIPQEVTT